MSVANKYSVWLYSGILLLALYYGNQPCSQKILLNIWGVNFYWILPQKAKDTKFFPQLLFFFFILLFAGASVLLKEAYLYVFHIQLMLTVLLLALIYKIPLNQNILQFSVTCCNAALGGILIVLSDYYLIPHISYMCHLFIQCILIFELLFLAGYFIKDYFNNSTRK